MNNLIEFNANSLFNLKDEVVLVTGSSGQLGSSIVDGLVSLNARVVATDLTDETLQNKASRHNWDQERVATYVCDVTSKADIELAIENGEKKFGEVTSLVANAGVSVFEPFLERSEESIDWVMDVNLKGTLFCIQAFLNNRINKGGFGSIVTIGSQYGIVSPDPRIYEEGDRKNSEIYGASKAGIIQMTKYFAVHAAEYNVRTNSVSPGGIRNSDHPQGKDFQNNYNYRCPMGRMAETHEIVGAILFLLSPAASYINGHNIVVDGGFSSW